MNQLRVLSLTASMLMPASRVAGQLPAPQQGVAWDRQVVACNDGTISFSVARAHLDPGLLSYQWEVAGWYNVDPGKCEEIGKRERYHTAIFGKDPVTLLAFAFYDSTGTWGSIRVSPGDGAFDASNQQFCVRPLDGFGYTRDSPGGDLPRVCDGKQTGYQMIPASFEYTGGVTAPTMYNPGNPKESELHVKLGPNDRAIPMGKQTSTSQGPGTMDDFAPLLSDIIEHSGRTIHAPDRGWAACIEPAVVEAQSWKNPPAARVKSLQDAVIQFLSIHDKGNVRFRITERSGNFVVEEYRGESCDPRDYAID